MFKMAKKPMYRLKNGPQNLQHSSTLDKDMNCSMYYCVVGDQAFVI